MLKIRTNLSFQSKIKQLKRENIDLQISKYQFIAKHQPTVLDTDLFSIWKLSFEDLNFDSYINSTKKRRKINTKGLI